jgi:hypothetical protein
MFVSRLAPTFEKLLVDLHQIAFFPVVLIENLGNVFSDSKVHKLMLSIIVPWKKINIYDNRDGRNSAI